MTTYYIDSNRGNDNFDGLSKNSPWKSLEAIRNKSLTGLIKPGDNFLFESESLFLPNRYLRLGSGSEPLTYINATLENRITFDKYSYNTISNTNPRFRLLLTPVSEDWKWDATKGLWYWEFPVIYGAGNLNWGAYPYVEINGVMCEITRMKSPTFDRGLDPYNQYQVSTDFSMLPGRLYVWTPNASSLISTNPTNVYGPSAIRAYSSNYGIFQFNRCGNYITFSNLEMSYSALLISIYQDATGATDITSFNVENCRTYQTSQLITSNMVSLEKNCDGLSLLNNNCELLAAGMFSGVSKNLLIKGNNIKTCNYSRSDGGAFYIASVISYSGYNNIVGYVEDNVIEDARYETGECHSDGCGIYLEAGTDNIIVRRNRVFNSPLALQDNTGKGTNIWYSNYIHNCDKAMTITDQSGQASTPTTVKVYNNTFSNISMNALYTAMPSARFAAVACRKGSNPASNYKYDFKNNIITSSNNNVGFGLLVEPGTTAICENNVIYNFAGGVKADEYSYSNIIIPATTLTSNPLLDTDGIPLPNSPVKNYGKKLSLEISDFNNEPFGFPFEAGAFKINTFKNIKGFFE